MLHAAAWRLISDVTVLDAFNADVLSTRQPHTVRQDVIWWQLLTEPKAHNLCRSSPFKSAEWHCSLLHFNSTLETACQVSVGAFAAHHDQEGSSGMCGTAAVLLHTPGDSQPCSLGRYVHVFFFCYSS